MASAVFTEAILIIASVIIAAGLAGVVMTKVGSFKSTFTQTTENQKQKVLTSIKIIYITNETKTSVNSYNITYPQNTELYFCQVNLMQRIPYSNPPSGLSWEFATPMSVWNQTNTVQINISNLSTIQC